jgi:hypothetical protein
MLSRLFRRAPSHPDVPDYSDFPEFPERADLPRLSDQEAGAALALLRLLPSAGSGQRVHAPLHARG